MKTSFFSNSRQKVYFQFSILPFVIILTASLIGCQNNFALHKSNIKSTTTHSSKKGSKKEIKNSKNISSKEKEIDEVEAVVVNNSPVEIEISTPETSSNTHTFPDSEIVIDTTEIQIIAEEESKIEIDSSDYSK